jgi:4-amino-4-deoxy-L-arabinose transferase-like glycosyltransferase
VSTTAAPPPLALRPLLGLGVGVAAVLLLVAGRYGYHRDELYFLQAGRHLAWGYPDQPPLTPLLARLFGHGDSLTVLRLPSALAAGGVVLLTGVLARDLGSDRRGQLVAAAAMAVSPVLAGVGHLLSTSTFDVLAWTALTVLFVRGVGAGGRWWVGFGLVAGAALLNKTLPAFLLAGLAAGVLLVGPRRILRDPWLWAGAVLALLLWLPNLWWQARHGWPQLELSRSIAAGSSGSSVDRWLFLPYQLLLVSPLLAPLWLRGLVRLLRDPAMRAARPAAVAYLVLTGVFVVTGGKPYYLAGLYPILLAAGAQVRTRVAGALAVTAVVSAVLVLPVLPVGLLHRTPIVALNYDTGETIGWPRFAQTLAAAYDALPAEVRARTVVLTGNYGEAGAVDRYGQALGLPPAYSGHNGYGLWGPPPADRTAVLAVGVPEAQLRELFGTVRRVGRIDDGVRVDNDEQGRPVWFADGLRVPWSQAWPQLRHLG